MELILVNESTTPLPRKFIQEWVDRLCRHLLRQGVMSQAQSRMELTLVFLEKKAAQKLNNEFRQRNYATDVLSFDSLDPSSLGELVLCPEVLKRQAREHKLSYRHELGYMILHGVLHLLGYDHETSEKDAERMFAIQDKAFAKLLK